ncbi:ABC transporter substrate-binding protein [Tsukamurella sp. 8F]|uniref:ABC transporter substrate-binding protein n=1 Tax=unclassified Tsukamurella TaxID=2633480 RepID=UPI0023B94F58|nr:MULTISPECIES: ABC transporter substrate-binding protein [unclassified Tsukamurella]MDF0529124.1 ABC transporter substrate-binding protein [Tsukamurella sp. 8J]MDF0588126.1 ABC transporter substrate-binding protein [Tsukamurella sp. 8F]
MSRHLRVLVAAVAALGLLAGCGSSNSESASESSNTSAVRTVATVQGEVAVPTAPKRVVVLNYALAGYAFHLGLPVTAVTALASDQDGEPAAAWADQAKKDGTQMLRWNAQAFNIEQITALKPDLIIAGGWGLPFKLATDGYANLSKIAPTVLVDKALTDWREQFQFLADKALGKPELYQDAVKAYEAKVAETKAKITLPELPVSYVSISGGAANPKAYVAIESTGIPKELSAVGLTPATVFAGSGFKPYTAGGDTFNVPDEDLSRVLDQKTVFVTGFNADNITLDQLKARPAWASLPAFQSGGAHLLPYWVNRADYDRSLDTLDEIAKIFPKK